MTKNDDDDEEEVQEIISSHHRALLVLGGGALSRSIDRDAIWTQRCEKISNKSSFGIIDIAEHSSTSDRIIVIVDTACFIHDGAYR